MEPPAPGPALTPPRPASRLRQRLAALLHAARASPTGRFALRIAVAILGALVVTVGAVLIPLPGPGWLIVLAGLGIWAVEFHWARRLLHFTRRHVEHWWKWITKQSWPVRATIGFTGIALAAVALVSSIQIGLGVNLLTKIITLLTTT